MKRLMMAAGFASLLGLAAGGILADENAKEKEIEKMMKAAHEGKSAPLANAKKQLGEDEPAWKSLKKDAETFTALGKKLREAKGVKSRPAKEYLDSALAFADAVAKEKKDDASKAFTGLTRTCAGCHYGGK